MAEERRLTDFTRGETIISPGPFGVGGRSEYRERLSADRLFLMLMGVALGVRLGVLDTLLAVCNETQT